MSRNTLQKNIASNKVISLDTAQNAAYEAAKQALNAESFDLKTFKTTCKETIYHDPVLERSEGAVVGQFQGSYTTGYVNGPTGKYNEEFVKMTSNQVGALLLLAIQKNNVEAFNYLMSEHKEQLKFFDTHENPEPQQGFSYNLTFKSLLEKCKENLLTTASDKIKNAIKAIEEKLKETHAQASVKPVAVKKEKTPLEQLEKDLQSYKAKNRPLGLDSRKFEILQKLHRAIENAKQHKNMDRLKNTLDDLAIENGECEKRIHAFRTTIHDFFGKTDKNYFNYRGELGKIIKTAQDKLSPKQETSTSPQQMKK